MPQPVNPNPMRMSSRSLYADLRRRRPRRPRGSARLRRGAADFQPGVLRLGAGVSAAEVETPVAMVTVTLEVFALVTPMLVGFREQVAFCGAPAQVRATVPLVPARPESCRAKVAVWPLVTIADEEPLTERPKSSPCPVRVTVRDFGRLAAVSVTDPETEPAAAGEKVMPSWQAAPMASVAEQLLVASVKPVVIVAARLVRS